MKNKLPCLVVLVCTHLIANVTTAALIPLEVRWDSSAPDTPADPILVVGGVYNLNDDWSSVPNGVSFVLNDNTASPLATMGAISNGAGLVTGSGLGVSDSVLSSGESIEFSFDQPVLFRGFETGQFSGSDTVIWQIAATAKAGIESAVLGDDGDLTVSVFLPANQPLSIASIGGDFDLRSLSVMLIPEPTTTRFSLVLIAICALHLRRRSLRNATARIDG